MATADAASATAELAASLAVDDIPVKLRCAACNKLAVNAFRLPCCEQAICEDCQVSLPQECYVCHHSPVKADDCKPNKALRTTVKAFLKRKAMEREATRKKESLEKQPLPTPTVSQVEPIAPAEAEPLTTLVTNGIEEHTSKVRGVTDAASIIHNDGKRNLTLDQPASSAAQMDIPRPSIESATEDQQEEAIRSGTHDGSAQQDKPANDELKGGADSDHGQTAGNKPVQQEHGGMSNGTEQRLSAGGIGFDGMGGFPDMGLVNPTDFNQMMQFMPNGMPGNMMGTFPNMMGMPGMGMDPMAMSQGMYGGFGGQGMDMSGINGMNMGMGFNAGHGAYGGYNGQAAGWNAGQNNYNPNAYGNHANGMNAGYGGYNMPSHQGNFNQMHHQQFPSNDFQHGYNGQNFHTRGRGRGRGYHNNARGRGGYNQVMQGNPANYEPFHHQLPPPVAPQNSVPQQQNQVPQHPEQSQVPNPDREAKQTDIDQAAEEQMNKELNPGGEIDDADQNSDAKAPFIHGSENPAEPATTAAPTESEAPVKPDNSTDEAINSTSTPIETFVSADPPEPQITKQTTPHTEIASPAPAVPLTASIPLGPAALYSGDSMPDNASRGRGMGRGFYRGPSETRGGFRGRGAGYLLNGVNTHPAPTHSPAGTAFPVVLAEPKGLGVEGAPKGPKALREGLPNTSLRGGRGFSIVGRAAQARVSGSARSRSASPVRHRSTSRSRSRSPARHRSRSRRRRSHRHRSTSGSGNDVPERRKDRHHRRSRKHEDNEKDPTLDRDGGRTREDSGDRSSKKSSHRNHRNYEKDGRSSTHRHSYRERSTDRDGERHRRRKRSRSLAAEDEFRDASGRGRSDSPTSSRRKEREELRRHRDRDDEDRPRDRKRSRRDRSESPLIDGSRRTSYRSKGADLDEKEKKEQVKSSADRRKSIGTPSKENGTCHSKAKDVAEPEKDHHTLEREARNRERLMKEMQRRVAMEGNGPKRRDSKVVEGKGGGAGRRVSYKYEDDESDEARTSRVESEREAGRWK